MYTIVNLMRFQMICLNFGIYVGKTFFFFKKKNFFLFYHRNVLAMKESHRALLVFGTIFDGNWSEFFLVYGFCNPLVGRISHLFFRELKDI